MTGKLKNLVQVIVFMLPASPVKNKLLRSLGHTVSPTARIGSCLVWGLGTLTARDRSTLRSGNAIRNIRTLDMAAQSIIGSFNYISASSVFWGLFRRDADYSRLVLERGAKIASRHTIDCSAVVTIGQFSSIAGHGTTVLTHSTEIDINCQVARPIRIGEHSFIGSHALLLGGAVIAKNSVLGAGAVATRWRSEDSPEPGFWAGVPAKRIGDVAGEWFSRSDTRTTNVFDPSTGTRVDDAF